MVPGFEFLNPRLESDGGTLFILVNANEFDTPRLGEGSLAEGRSGCTLTRTSYVIGSFEAYSLI